MQPASSTTQQFNHVTTTTSTASTSSTNADRPPTVRTAAKNQRKVTVRRDKDSSEESTEKEKNTDKKSQSKPGKRDAYKKAHKKGQAQYQAQRELPRYNEKNRGRYSSPVIAWCIKCLFYGDNQRCTPAQASLV